MRNQSLAVTLTRRGEYAAAVNHFHDRGYTILLNHTGEIANRNRFIGFDVVANRIFFEAVGLNISTGTTAGFDSIMDICRVERNRRYGGVGIDDLCVPHVHTSMCFEIGCIRHVHSPSCWDASGHLTCIRIQHCYPYSCSDAMRHLDHIMGLTRTVTTPGAGSRGNIVSVWTGNATDWNSSPDRSFVDAIGGTNIFMSASREDYATINSITGIYIHELGHIFRAPDHAHAPHPESGDCVGYIYCWNIYCEPELLGRSPRTRYCIMVDPRPENITTRHAHGLFCNDCIGDMEEHLADNLNHYRRDR